MNDLLIITSGGSQLLTQIATLEYLNINPSKIQVVYIGVFSESLVACIKNICYINGIEYLTSISNVPSPKKFYFSRVIHPRTFWNEIRKNGVRNLPEVFRVLKNKPTMITFRQKMLGDTILVNYLKPTSLFLTADGVIATPVKRNINFWQYGLNTKINRVPVDLPIYSPCYLAVDSKKVAPVKILPDDILKMVFDKMLNVNDYRKINDLLQKKNFGSIIFSQHLALNNNCSEEMELRYYRDIVSELIRIEKYPVVFKPHPRDTLNKIKKQKEIFKEFGEKIIILENEFSVVPVEIFYKVIQSSKAALITASSSSCLAVNSDSNQLISFTADYLPFAFRQEIEEFSKRFKTNLLKI